MEDVKIPDLECISRPNLKQDLSDALRLRTYMGPHDRGGIGCDLRVICTYEMKLLSALSIELNATYIEPLVARAAHTQGVGQCKNGTCGLWLNQATKPCS